MSLAQDTGDTGQERGRVAVSPQCHVRPKRLNVTSHRSAARDNVTACFPTGHHLRPGRCDRHRAVPWRLRLSSARGSPEAAAAPAEQPRAHVFGISLPGAPGAAACLPGAPGSRRCRRRGRGVPRERLRHIRRVWCACNSLWPQNGCHRVWGLKPIGCGEPRGKTDRAEGTDRWTQPGCTPKANGLCVHDLQNRVLLKPSPSPALIPSPGDEINLGPREG